MLSDANRMRHGREFAAAVRGGRRAGRRALVVHLSQLDAIEPARVGFVVSKAVGNAVTRNRVKRRLRHLVRERVGLLPAGSLTVVRANPAAAGTADLARDLDGALASALRRAPSRGHGAS